MKTPLVLVIEDDDLQYEIYEDALAGDCRLERVRTGTAALAFCGKTPPDLIILDHILDRGETGLSFLPELKELLPFVPVVVVSGALEVQQQMEALQGPRRAHFCLTKPVDIHELKQTVRLALAECGEKEVIRQFEALERAKRLDAQEWMGRSTDRLSRQTQIRQLVAQTRERPNVSALARQFEVARRTIIRDLQELIRRGEISPDIYPEARDFKEDGET